MEPNVKFALREAVNTLQEAQAVADAATDALSWLADFVGSFCSLCGGFVAPGEAVPTVVGSGHETCAALDGEMATTGVPLPSYVYKFVGNLSATAATE